MQVGRGSYDIYQNSLNWTNGLQVGGGLLGLGGNLPIWRRLPAEVATTDPVTQAGQGISNWLGEGARVLRNDARGFVILSRDGLRRFRVDFAGPGTPLHTHTWKCGTRHARNGLTQSLVDIGFLLLEELNMAAYEAIANRPGAYRVVLEERAEGVYVNVFEHPSSTEPYIDILQSDLKMAMRACYQDYGIEEHQWRPIPDVDWHAPAAGES